MEGPKHRALANLLETPQEECSTLYTSFLDKLPPELRNRIYGMMVINVKAIDIRTERQPAISRSCRQTRQECLGLYFFCNKFSFKITSKDDDCLQTLKCWLSRIGRTNSALIRKLVIYLGPEHATLITDPRKAEDPWSALVVDLEARGCSSKLLLRVQPANNDLPPEYILERLRRIVGPEAKSFLAKLQEKLTLALTLYVNILFKLQVGKPASSQKLASLLAPTDARSVMRHFAFVLSCTIRGHAPVLDPPFDIKRARINHPEFSQRFWEWRWVTLAERSQ